MYSRIGLCCGHATCREEGEGEVGEAGGSDTMKHYSGSGNGEGESSNMQVSVPLL